MTLFVAFGAALVAKPSTLGDAGRAVYVVAPVRSAVANDERIGARRTGQLCLPAGSTRWSDVSLDPVGVAEAVASALTDRGLRALTNDDLAGEPLPGGSARQRLTITVTFAHIDTCVPQHGLVRLVGGRGKLKASGSLKVRWRVVDVTSGQPPREREIEQALDAGEGQPLSRLVQTAIVRAVTIPDFWEDAPAPQP